MVVRLGGRTFGPDDYAVMAIVNRTPDSFYDGGLTLRLDVALRAVETAVAGGTDIGDIGGVRAGYGPAVGVDEELRRALPVVKNVRERFPELVISVDTGAARSPRGSKAPSPPSRPRHGRARGCCVPMTCGRHAECSTWWRPSRAADRRPRPGRGLA
ncbi:MAG: dihydropteroate synthase [Pseudonocardiales bacterium]|nr:dihydropteroate synthase [Pseudonocardiales bacterium]